MAETAAKDYAEYTNFNLNQKLAPVTETIDDMLTRLEEFEGLVAMVQEASGRCVGTSGVIPSVASDHLSDVTSICAKVDALEKLVERISAELDGLEARVSNAEVELGAGDGNGVFKSIFRPFFKRTPEPRPAASRSPTVERFNADDYFPEKTD